MTDTKNEWPEKVRVSFSNTGSFEGIVWRFADAAIKPEGGALVSYIRADLVKPIQAEPVAWMNPENGVVIDCKRKLQIGEGDGYPKFNVPLYTAPQPQFTPELLQSVLDALRIGEENADILQKKYSYLNVIDFNGDKIRAAIAALEKYRGKK